MDATPTDTDPTGQQSFRLVRARPARAAVPSAAHSRFRITPGIVALVDVMATLAVLFAADLDVPQVALAALIAVTVLAMERTYRRKLTLSVLDDLPRLALAAAAAVLVSRVLLQHPQQPLPTGLLIITELAVLTLGRMASYGLIRSLRRRGRTSARTLIIGGGEIGSRLTSNAIEHRELGLDPVGIVDANPIPATQMLRVPIITPDAPLAEVISSLRVDTVVVAFSEARESDLLATLRTCDRLDCEMLVVPRLFELASLTGDMQLVRDLPLTQIRRAPYRTLEWRLKRVFDILFSATALILLSPLLLLIALVVWLSDRSAPVLFRQIRIGVDGLQFGVLKFRTLKPADENESATRWNIAKDERLGRVGNFLRRSSLDELPQLLNVLGGQMSVVGPRPERPHFAAEFSQAMAHYGARHRVPMGLTGWAAVHGLRGDTSVRERAAYDNYYIENWSLWLDAKIILRTVLEVLRRSGG